MKRLDYTPAGLDAGHFTAPVVESLERRNILDVFGYRRTARTKNTFKKNTLFTVNYSKERDSCYCLNEQELIYKTISRDAYREHHSDPKECAFYPIRDNCTQSKNMKKFITRHIYANAVDRANQMRLYPYGKKTDRQRREDSLQNA